MFCHHCGVAAGEGHSFCASCGSALGTAATAMPGPAALETRLPQVNRLDKHRQVLGTLWMAAGVLRLASAAGLYVASQFDFGLFGIPFVEDLWFPEILYGMSMVLLALAIGAFVVGFGLLDRQPWARPLAIILGILALIRVPLETALGIYTLWVLLPAERNGAARRAAQTA